MLSVKHQLEPACERTARLEETRRHRRQRDPRAKILMGEIEEGMGDSGKDKAPNRSGGRAELRDVTS
jgi:hypothetical protein